MIKSPWHRKNAFHPSVFFKSLHHNFLPSCVILLIPSRILLYIIFGFTKCSFGNQFILVYHHHLVILVLVENNWFPAKWSANVNTYTFFKVCAEQKRHKLHSWLKSEQKLTIQKSLKS